MSSMSLQIKVAAFQYPVHREKLAVSSCFKSRSFSLHLLCVQSVNVIFSFSTSGFMLLKFVLL